MLSLLLFTPCANHRICLLDCQDIDDALHARLLPNGNIEAGVRKAFSNLSSLMI